MDIPIFETDNSISAKAFRDGYELGKSNVKSSLKRDIEKVDRLFEGKIWTTQDILELIETVEP